MKEIQLTQGKVALVDDCDYEYLSQWKWRPQKMGNTTYVLRRGPRPARQVILMHRVIMDAGQGQLIDHRDHDGLNNQRGNLRFCSRVQNMVNSKKRASVSSEFKGCSFDNTRKKWAAQISVNGKNIHLGRFNNPIDAARAYDTAAVKYYGEFASTNFSD